MDSQEDEASAENFTQQELLAQIGQQRTELTKKNQMIQVLQVQVADQERALLELKEQSERMRLSLEALIKVQNPTTVAATAVTTTLTNTVPTMVSTPTVTFTTDLTSTYPSASQWKPHTVPPGLGAGAIPTSAIPMTSVTTGSKAQVPPISLITLDDSLDSSEPEPEPSEDDLLADPDMRRMAELMGRRETPKPEPYDLASGRSFRKFLESFEAYCGARYSREKQSLWTPELGRFLRGEALIAFNAFGGPERGYRKMKKKLQDWFHEARDRTSASRRGQYKEARILHGEGFKLFAIRLENLYRAAYPGKSVDGKDLKHHLLEILPQAVSDTLERDLALLRAANSRSNTWNDVLLLLGLQDEATRRNEGRQASRQASMKRNQPWSGVRTQSPAAIQVVTTVPQSPVRKPKWGKSKSRSPARLYCNYCKRPGHGYDTCRRRLNQCLRCGCSDHFVVHCPLPQTQTAGRRPKSGDRRRTSSSSDSNEDARKSRSKSTKHYSRIFRRGSETGASPPLNC